MQQSQANPPATTTAVSTAPTPEVSFFSVDYINSVSGSAGPRGAQAAVLFKIQETLTIIDIGPLTNSNTEQTFAVESQNPFRAIVHSNHHIHLTNHHVRQSNRLTHHATYFFAQ